MVFDGAWAIQAWQLGGIPLVILGAFFAWLRRSPDAPGQLRKDIEERFATLEENLNGKIGALGDKVDARMAKSEHEIHSAVERLSKVEGRINGWLDNRSARPVTGGANGEDKKE